MTLHVPTILATLRKETHKTMVAGKSKFAGWGNRLKTQDSLWYKWSLKVIFWRITSCFRRPIFNSIYVFNWLDEAHLQDGGQSAYSEFNNSNVNCIQKHVLKLACKINHHRYIGRPIYLCLSIWIYRYIFCTCSLSLLPSSNRPDPNSSPNNYVWLMVCYWISKRVKLLIYAMEISHLFLKLTRRVNKVNVSTTWRHVWHTVNAQQMETITHSFQHTFIYLDSFHFSTSSVTT